MATVDIIIPAFNAAKTIEKCLQTIWNQTYTDYAITIVNDGSTDATASILKKYQNRLQVINEKNAGAAAARNAGADHATGTYIIFVDADVLLESNALEEMVNALERVPEASYAYASFIFGKKTFTLWPFDGEKLRQMPYIHTTSLIRRNAFPGFDASLKRFQDWDLWLTMLKKNKKGIWVDKILFHVLSGGTMSRWRPSFFYSSSLFKWLPSVQAYTAAMRIIKKKHNITFND